MIDNEQNLDKGKVITLFEAGEILHISYSTVRRLAESGELPAFRIRDSWRTTTVACQEYIERGFGEQSIMAQSVRPKQ